jgi:hypothetical protein
MLRTAVAVFLIASMASGFIFIARLSCGGTLAVSAVASFLLIAMFRWIALGILDQDRLKRRVLVLGTGARAEKIASRMRRRYDQRGFLIHGYLPFEKTTDQVSKHGGTIMAIEEPLIDLCNPRIDIVVASTSVGAIGQSAGLPLDELLECRLSGIEVCDVQAFIEREAGSSTSNCCNRRGWFRMASCAARGNREQTRVRPAASLGLLVVVAHHALRRLRSGSKGFEVDPVPSIAGRIGQSLLRCHQIRSMRTDAEQGATVGRASTIRVSRVSVAFCASVGSMNCRRYSTCSKGI